jgi:hypothetical protein
MPDLGGLRDGNSGVPATMVSGIGCGEGIIALGWDGISDALMADATTRSARNLLITDMIMFDFILALLAQ